MLDIRLYPKLLADHFRQLIHRIRLVGADIEYFIIRGGNGHALRDGNGYIIDITKGPRLRAISENSQLFPLHDLVHKDPDHIAILIPDILIRSIYIMGTENDIVQPEHLMRRPEMFGLNYVVFRPHNVNGTT